MSRYVGKHSSVSNQKKTRQVEKGLVAGSVLTAALIPSPFAAQNVAYANTANDREAFVEEIGSLAQEVANANGLYASVMVAQAIHESNWGQSQLSSAPYYNFFGVKGSYNGQSVGFPTQEYLNGEWVTVTANFRSYPSYRESLQDNANLLKTTNFGSGYFYAGAWKENTNSYLDATSYLTGRYATDPNYANALNNLIATYDLTRFDTGTGTTIAPSIELPAGPSFDYTVKAGDTLWKIANEHQTSVAEIKQLNKLISDGIYIDQILKIPGTQQVSAENNTENQEETINPETPLPPKVEDISGDNFSYTVKAGDSLWRIANKYQTTVIQIKQLNQLTSDTIYVNQTLKIPGIQKETAEAENTPNPAIPKVDLDISKPDDTVVPESKNDETSEFSVPKIDVEDLVPEVEPPVTPAEPPVSESEPEIEIEVDEPKLDEINEPSTEEIPVNETLPEETFNYKVKAGDTLWKIANDHQTSVERLKVLNMLTFDTIYINQTLQIPGSPKETTSVVSENESTTPTAESLIYSVKAGDSLWKIANEYNTSVDHLKSLNNLSGDTIYINQQLKVPRGISYTSYYSVKEHTVKAGDTLWELAQTYQTTVSELQRLNNISGSLIYVGQNLKIR